MKRFNLNEFIWFLILLGFTYFIFDLIYTGSIFNFLHPRMIIHVKFALAVFILLIVFQVKKIFTISHTQKLRVGYIMFIIPLILAFTVNPQGLNSEIVAKKGINLTQKPQEVSSPKTQTVDDNSDDGDNMAESAAENPERDFLDIVDEAYMDMENGIGKSIELSGFVFKDNSFENNQFVVARMLMVCCAADAEVVGLLCEWEDGKTLKSDEWVKVTGVIDMTKMLNIYSGEEEEIPVIRADSVEYIDPPLTKYVYP